MLDNASVLWYNGWLAFALSGRFALKKPQSRRRATPFSYTLLGITVGHFSTSRSCYVSEHCNHQRKRHERKALNESPINRTTFLFKYFSHAAIVSKKVGHCQAFNGQGLHTIVRYDPPRLHPLIHLVSCISLGKLLAGCTSHGLMV